MKGEPFIVTPDRRALIDRLSEEATPIPVSDIDWGDDADAPLTCGLENPDYCESCQ